MPSEILKISSPKPKSTTQRHSLKLNLFYFKSSLYNFILVLLYYPSGQQVSKQKNYGFEVWTFPNHLSDSKIFFWFSKVHGLAFFVFKSTEGLTDNTKHHFFLIPPRFTSQCNFLSIHKFIFMFIFRITYHAPMP